MRLICPNCGAQYEVDDAVIPAQGRDVQCSNCGHTWFQPPAHVTETEDDFAPEQIAPDPGQDPEPPEPPEPDADTQRQELDPDIARVLREEAAREAEVRKAEAEALETQGELGIDEGDAAVSDRSAAARARMARLRGQEEGGPAAEAGAAIGRPPAGSRSDLLPDVEEINSSLRPTEEREAVDQATMAPDPELKVEQSRQGGRFAFRLILILVLIAIAVYIYAPFIAQYVPAAEPALAAYVAAVNTAREQLTSLIQQGVAAFQNLTGGGGGA